MVALGLPDIVLHPVLSDATRGTGAILHEFVAVTCMRGGSGMIARGCAPVTNLLGGFRVILHELAPIVNLFSGFGVVLQEFALPLSWPWCRPHKTPGAGAVLWLPGGVSSASAVLAEALGDFRVVLQGLPVLFQLVGKARMTDEEVSMPK